MAAGVQTYKGLAVPLYGESTITQITSTTDLLTLKAASTAPTGDALVIADSAGTEKKVFGVDAYLDKWVMGTVALASLASNAGTGTVTVTGLTTGHIVSIYANVSTLRPNVYVSAANVLAYCPPGALGSTAAMTVNVMALLTA